MLVKVEQDPRTTPLMVSFPDGREVYLRRIQEVISGDRNWQVKCFNPNNELEHQILEFGMNHDAMTQLMWMFGAILKEELQNIS